MSEEQSPILARQVRDLLRERDALLRQLEAQREFWAASDAFDQAVKDEAQDLMSTTLTRWHNAKEAARAALAAPSEPGEVFPTKEAFFEHLDSIAPSEEAAPTEDAVVIPEALREQLIAVAIEALTSDDGWHRSDAMPAGSCDCLECRTNVAAAVVDALGLEQVEWQRSDGQLRHPLELHAALLCDATPAEVDYLNEYVPVFRLRSLEQGAEK